MTQSGVYKHTISAQTQGGKKGHNIRYLGDGPAHARAAHLQTNKHLVEEPEYVNDVMQRRGQEVVTSLQIVPPRPPNVSLFILLLVQHPN